MTTLDNAVVSSDNVGLYDDARASSADCFLTGAGTASCEVVSLNGDDGNVTELISQDGSHWRPLASSSSVAAPDGSTIGGGSTSSSTDSPTYWIDPSTGASMSSIAPTSADAENYATGPGCDNNPASSLPMCDGGPYGPTENSSYY